VRFLLSNIFSIAFVHIIGGLWRWMVKITEEILIVELFRGRVLLS
jgi:hypothetical protein